MSLLNKLTKSTSKTVKRVGRGYGSGKGGHTSSRGQKGQRARVGAKIPLWFEGGQLQLGKRLPMLRGKARFNVLNPTVELTLKDLQSLKFDSVTMESLKLNKVIDRRAKKVKIISKGSLDKKLTITGIAATPKAKAAIEKAGGSVN